MSTAEKWDLELTDLPEMPEPAEDGTIAPQFIPDDNLANDALRYLSYWYRERQRIQEQATHERLRIDDLERRELERIDRRIA